MSGNRTKKIGECVYCGKIGLITDDHIPPKSLFAKPRPSNLIKVPSCKECHGENKQVSQDDEYFRLMLTLREDTADHPDVEKILPIVFRSLTRPDKVGFTRSLLNNARYVNARTPSGLYLGKKAVYDVDLARLDNVAKRIAKGLFYHETAKRLPDEYEVIAYSESGLQNLSRDVREDLQVNVIRSIMAKTPQVIGNNVFLYRVAFTNEDVYTSAWLFTFYERVSFLCITSLKDGFHPDDHQL